MERKCSCSLWWLPAMLLMLLFFFSAAEAGDTAGESKAPELEGEPWKDEPANSPPGEKWQVVFNRPVKESSLEGGILVLDGEGQPHPVELELGEEKRKVKVVPAENYETGHSYYLQMTGDIKARTGGTLADPRWLEFRIQEEGVANGQEKKDPAPEGPVSEAFSPGDHVRTGVRVLRVRENPGTGAGELGKKIKGSLLRIEDERENGVKKDGYHWWKVSFGPVGRGWVAEEYLEEYEFPFDASEENVSSLERARLTQYHVAGEGEIVDMLKGGSSHWTPEIIDRFNALGSETMVVDGREHSFNRAFLYSVLGVSMQGTGLSDSGHLVEYGGGGATGVNGENARFLDKWGNPIPDSRISNTRPYWRANEEAIQFNIFCREERNYIRGAHSQVHPWYSAAVPGGGSVPPGSIIYIEELDGVELTCGEELDGLFMAGDRVSSGMVDGYDTHLDIFTGMGREGPEQWKDIWQGRSRESSIIYDHSVRWDGKSVRLREPGELRVYDNEGRVTGLKGGTVYEEIPFTSYDEEKRKVKIACPEGVYTYRVSGVEKEEYSLAFYSQAANKEELVFSDIPYSSSREHGREAVHSFSVDWDMFCWDKPGLLVNEGIPGSGVVDRTWRVSLQEPLD